MDKDKGSKTDAFIVLYAQWLAEGQNRLGTTEVVKDSLNPEFVSSIEVDFFFEEN